LQIPDPQHEFSQRRGVRVDLDAEQLRRGDGLAFEREAVLRLAEFGELVEHFAFEALQVFEGDVKKISAATCRVEHAQGA